MFDKYGESAAPCGIDPERVILETHDLTRQYEQSDEVITAVNRANKDNQFIPTNGCRSVRFREKHPFAPAGRAGPSECGRCFHPGAGHYRDG